MVKEERDGAGRLHRRPKRIAWTGAHGCSMASSGVIYTHPSCRLHRHTDAVGTLCHSLLAVKEASLTSSPPAQAERVS